HWIAFGFSFFWGSIPIIYRVLRKVADGAELDEVSLEDDETEGVFGSSLPPAPPPSAPPATTKPLTMVEPPALRPSPEPTAITPSTEPKTESSPASGTPPSSPNSGTE